MYLKQILILLMFLLMVSCVDNQINDYELDVKLEKISRDKHFDNIEDMFDSGSFEKPYFELGRTNSKGFTLDLINFKLNGLNLFEYYPLLSKKFMADLYIQDGDIPFSSVEIDVDGNESLT